jgi:hypothetical protein
MGPLAQGRSFRADNLLYERRKSVRCAHLVPNLAQMSSEAQLLDQPVSKRHFFFRLDPRPTHTASRAVKPPTQPAIAGAGNPSDHFKFENHSSIKTRTPGSSSSLLLTMTKNDMTKSPVPTLMPSYYSWLFPHDIMTQVRTI